MGENEVSGHRKLEKKVPPATGLNESTSPGVFISQQPNCHMKNSNLYRALQAEESSHFHGPFPISQESSCEVNKPKYKDVHLGMGSELFHNS